MWKNLLAEILLALRLILAPVWRRLLALFGRYVQEHLSLEQTVRRTSQIRAVLAELRVLVHADRVAVFEFHNGGVFSNKNPQWRIACTHEVHGPGVQPTETHTQPILASRVQELIQPLFDAKAKMACETICPVPNCGKRLIVQEVQELEMGYGKSLLMEQGVDSYIQAPLYDLNDIVCGYLSVDYCSFGHDNEMIEATKLAKEHARRICEYAHRVEFILNNKDADAETSNTD